MFQTSQHIAARVSTPQEVSERLRASGIPVTAWAQAHGFAPAVIYALLNGRTRGHRGAAHRAAIALGLKIGAAVPDSTRDLR